MTSTDIQAISSIIGAFAALVICYQLFLIKSHFTKDHIHKRNLYSNEILRWWVENSSNRVMASVRQVVETFTNDQCENLVNNETVHLTLPQDNDNQKEKREFILEKLKVCLEESFKNVEVDESRIKILPAESSKLRSLATRYLNSMETVCSTWRHHLSSREIIEEEFKWIIHKNKNYRMLQNYREASGGLKAFPAIHEFVRHLDPEIPPGKPPIKG